MKKLFILVLLVFCETFSFVYAKDVKDRVVSNKLFSITIPKELNGTYSICKKHNRIELYHK